MIADCFLEATISWIDHVQFLLVTAWTMLAPVYITTVRAGA